MRRIIEPLLDLLYPSRCCACGTATAAADFCATCTAAFRTIAPPLCTVCGAPFHSPGANHPCGRCITRRPRFRRARACALYDASARSDDPLKLVLQRYKYLHQAYLARPLGRVLARHATLDSAQYDVIVPVPLHVQRLRWRGFNQAQLLALELAARLALPIDAFSLERVRPTRPQVQLDDVTRRRNVARAFRVSRPDRIAGRRVLLVDDVYTTGATVEECSRALRRAGARFVDVWVLGRAATPY